jgi:6-phosphogluconolactonase (cycloisomerase 2 family)
MPRSLNALFAAAVAAAALTATASAGTLYTNNYNDEQLAALSIGADGELTPLAGSPFTQPHAPSGLAIAPDGNTLVETFSFDHFVGTRALGEDGSIAATGPEVESATTNLPAVAPNGRFVYVGSYPTPGVLTYALGSDASLTQVGGAVGAGVGAGVAVTPDGRYLLLPSAIGGEIERFAIGADGTPSPLGTTPTGGEGVVEVRVTPDGRFAVALIDAAGKDRLRAFSIGPDGSLAPAGPAVETADVSSAQVIVAPNGKLAYLTSHNEKSITAYAIAADGSLSQAGTPVEAEFLGPDGMGMSDDGRFLYVQPEQGEIVQAFAVAADGSLTKLGGTVPTGGVSDHTTPVPRPAVPVASLGADPGAPHKPTAFDASGSHDVGATITGYEWDFGDGATMTTSHPTAGHVYEKAGVYGAEVTVVDDVGCSGFVYTGQSAYCDGRQATATAKVDTLPAILGIRGRGNRRGKVTFHYKLSERAKVVFKIRRAGRRHRTLRSFRVKGKAGKNKARLKGRLKLGRYVAVAVATDSAGGRSAPAKAAFKVRKRRTK